LHSCTDLEVFIINLRYHSLSMIGNAFFMFCYFLFGISCTNAINFNLIKLISFSL
jgi:hypothetical protein